MPKKRISCHLIKLVMCQLIMVTSLYSQSNYYFNLKKEALHLGIGSVSTGLGIYFLNRDPLFTTDELSSLDRNDINRLDRIATHNNSASADLGSDFLWFGSISFPLAFLAGRETRNDFGPIMALYGEATFINFGITVMLKHTFDRPRPFVFNETFETESKLKRSAKTAFVSGHTSITATNCFFVAKVFSDYYPDSKWKPVVWIAAAAIPAVTGYLRVAAGKHYPTDVIAGYALGAATGYLVPHFHQVKKPTHLSISGGINSLLVQYRF